MKEKIFTSLSFIFSLGKGNQDKWLTWLTILKTVIDVFLVLAIIVLLIFIAIKIIDFFVKKGAK